MIDQAMFNPSSYRDMPDLAAQALPTYLPDPGLSGYLTLMWVVHHVVWSVGVPIALAEALFPARARTPWLGGPGTVLTALVFAMAAAVTVQWHLETEEVHASPAQLMGAGAVVLALAARRLTASRTPQPARQT